MAGKFSGTKSALPKKYGWLAPYSLFCQGTAHDMDGADRCFGCGLPPLHWSGEKIYRKPKALCALWSLNFADIGNPFKYFQSGLPAVAVCAEIRAGAEKRCAYGKVMAGTSDTTEKIAPVLPRIHQRFALILCCMITASFFIHTPFALMLNR